MKKQDFRAKVAHGQKQLWSGMKKGVSHAVQSVSLTFAIPALLSAILLGLFLWRRYIRWNITCNSENRLDGKTAIVTGANSGIGRATSQELARRGARVILACRNLKKGDAVARVISKKTGNDDVHAAELDLGSIRSIREFAEYIKENEKSLHILVNNAGYMGPKQSTEDGYERCFGVNYLGHFYLTYMLKDLLAKCAPSRIINVTSDSYVTGKIEYDDLPMKNYDIYKAYARSKLALMHFSVEAHRLWFPEVIMSFAVQPGWVHTDILRNWPGLSGNLLRTFAEFMFKSPEEGCQTIVYCAVADGLKECSGRLLENCRMVTMKDHVVDKEACRKLWEVSVQLCGLEPDVQFAVDEHTESKEGARENKTDEDNKSDAVYRKSKFSSNK